MSITQGSDTYYYVTNIQGDVIAILNSSGTAVVEYAYDAWGNIVSTTGSMATTLGKWNPLRYRGYVYDEETSLYYLQSRYYNPEIGRFINADAFASTGQGLLGNNMFLYCNSNPVNFQDDMGTRMEYVSFDCGAPCGFPSPSTISAQTAGNSTSVDSKENILTRLAKDVQSVVDGLVDLYYSPLVQRPSGTKKLVFGLKRIRAGYTVLIVPDPTLADEISGYTGIFRGYVEVLSGIKGIFNNGMQNGDSLKEIINTIFEEVQ
ncbi:MAG: RHS repeat-associated core domain-containing protein [Oscillospiraceae bacterium]|nr:RHS repeat-associated core domain-containing protein [Oscillospiraceae bacterium]